MAKKSPAAKENAFKRKEEYKEPKKLSKIGVWMRKHPNGIGEILDMRAVLK
jgi:hypothetical protein